ncbi:ABC transporter ATP-binding protein [Roseateles sp. GG27B]
MTPLLTLTHVSKSFGPLKVTDDLSFELQRGEALGILGPNGAGKTTMFNLISGDTRADSGRVQFKGRDITRDSPHQRCRAGIGRSYQIALPFEGMTVFENLLVGAMFGAEPKSKRQAEREAYDRCVDLLDRTGLLDKANRLAGSLTLLDRKRLELARALATDPELLLLDEIAGGLTEQEAHQLVELVDSIRRQGISIIWIEHVVHALIAVATRLLVINFGAKLAEGDPQQVLASPAVRRVYMGIEV